MLWIVYKGGVKSLFRVILLHRAHNSVGLILWLMTRACGYQASSSIPSANEIGTWAEVFPAHRVWWLWVNVCTPFPSSPAPSNTPYSVVSHLSNLERQRESQPQYSVCRLHFPMQLESQDSMFFCRENTRSRGYMRVVAGCVVAPDNLFSFFGVRPARDSWFCLIREERRCGVGQLLAWLQTLSVL
jgi:hypothetical protein